MNPILEARLKLKLTRKQAAERIGISVRQLFGWEIKCPNQQQIDMAIGLLIINKK